MEFKLVYGNHGNNPFHIMDVLLLIKLSLESLGHKADLEERMVPGKTNILLECFTYDFLEAMKEVRRTTNTEFIIVASELVTGKTFNDFSDTDEESAHRSHYDMPWYWQKRYRTFLLTQEMASAVWCLSDNQLEAYREATGNSRIFYLPHGYIDGFSRVRHNPQQHKDIDAIFTGTPTKRRRLLIQELQKRGIKAVTTKPLISPQREDLIARSKIGLNIKQSDSWPYPSNSRYHYHLSNESLLISEHCPVRCDLSSYIIESGAENFVDCCSEMLSSNIWAREARERKERFMAEMPMQRLMGCLLESTYSENS